MHIAIIADPIDNQSAGIHVFTQEMVDAMIRTNPGHKIILIREKRDPELKGAEQICLWNTRLPIGYASLRLFIMIPWILHRKRADVVIEPAHFGPFNLIKRIKRVTIIHDLTPILFPQLHRWHSQLLQKIFLKRILNKTDLIIANSDHTANDICKVYPQNCNKVHRIYPGKNKIYEPTNKAGVPGKYNISGPYILFVGTIEPRKNLIVLLEAFRIFKEKNESPLSLVIAGGTGWKSDLFFNKLKDHPYKDEIICTGFIDTSDLPTLYSQATVFVYPSLYEGFGLPVLEALSCGTPVISANNSSLTEAGGEVSFYFDANDPFALAEQLNKIIGDPNLREKIAQQQKDHVNNFDWDKFAVKFWDLIVKVN